MGAWDWIKSLFAWDSTSPSAPNATPLTAPLAPAIAVTSPGTVAPTESASDPVVGPAYAYLSRWTRDERKALLDVQAELGLDPSKGALPGVIQHESGGDPSVPVKKEGTPRAGLIQLTVGARLPGFLDAESVWAARSWDVTRQLKEIVVPAWKRFGASLSTWDLRKALRSNGLPVFANAPASKVVGVRPGTEGPGGEKPEDKIPGGLSLGAIFTANPGLAHGKSYITMGDFDTDADKTSGAAHGQVITVSGKVLDANTGKVTGGQTPSVPTGVAPALTALLEQVNKNWPNRLKASDGTLPSQEHLAQSPNSDHNHGNALDITYDPTNGPNLDDLSRVCLADERTSYVIWNKRIANPTIQNGEWRAYDGANPHTRHMHVSVLASKRDDSRPWPQYRDGQTVVPPAPSTTPATATDIPSLVKRGILPAWKNGEVDNVTWTRIPVGGGYEVKVTNEPLSVKGVRLPTSFDDVIAIAPTMKALPPTKEIADAVWKATENGKGKRYVFQGTSNQAGALLNDPGQVETHHKHMGAISTVLADGDSKDWIISPELKEGTSDVAGTAINYGARKADGSVWQTPGHVHNRAWKDYSQLNRFVSRTAYKNGAEVDLLNVLSDKTALGGPIPAFILEKLKG